jgi:hypothetical protein
MKRWTLLVLSTVATGFIACSADNLSAPRDPATTKTTGSDSTPGQTNSDTVVTTTPPQPQPPIPDPVSHFELKVIALGALPGADTSAAERVPGATVTVVRVGGIAGDTLATSETLGTATTNANGEATFAQLPGGYYTIRIAPPAGSALAPTQTAIPAPRSDQIVISVTMRKL